jgi:hypothetical protein
VDRRETSVVEIPLMMSRARYAREWDDAVFYVGYGTSETEMMQAGRLRPVLTVELDNASD